MHKNNHKYRRMVDRLPDEMKQLMQHLDHECVVLAHHAGGAAWKVDFQIKKNNLYLAYDRGYLEVMLETETELRSLSPKNIDEFKVTIEDLANEVNQEFV